MRLDFLHCISHDGSLFISQFNHALQSVVLATLVVLNAVPTYVVKVTDIFPGDCGAISAESVALEGHAELPQWFSNIET